MLHYKTIMLQSDKPWVTFIHGAGGSSAIWYKQIKEFKKHFNLLLVDLRGHGKSERGKWKKGDTFEEIADDVIEVLDHLNISSSHFVGISLGTVIIQTIAQKNRSRIETMVLGGAVTHLRYRSRFLLTVGNMSKYILPYMWLYKLLAWIIMPRNHHLESRNAFVQQAKKLCQKEFIRWFTLTKAINPFLKRLQNDFFNIPTLFVMGQEDHMFLIPVKQIVEQVEETKLVCLKDAGHVCNIDQADSFNQVVIDFIYPSGSVQKPLTFISG